MDNTECRFCRKKFKSKSTLGRHLDLKKADELHPAEEVDAIRGSVVRRGENKQIDEEKQNHSRLLRQKASRAYNSKDSVKERNRVRRKLRDARISAAAQANKWYLDRLSKGKLTEARTFPQLCAVYLAPLEWLEVPGEAQLQKLLAKLGDKPDFVFGAWNEWKSQGNQREIWLQESRDAMMKTLNEMSCHELRNCISVVEKKQGELYDKLSHPELYDMIDEDGVNSGRDERQREEEINENT